MIYQELREVMEKIESLKPEWKLAQGAILSAEQEFSDLRYKICLEKQIAEGIIRCEIKVGPTGASEDNLWGDGREGDEIFSHNATVKVSLAKHSDPDKFICFFSECYGGAKYVLFKKRTFWKGYIKYMGKRLIKNPSEEYQFLRKYVEAVDAALYKAKTEEQQIAEKERNQKYQQQEQDCKKIFFGR